jgi:membrane-bound ClpP family serine protease
MSCFFYGPLFPTVDKAFRDFIEELKSQPQEIKSLTIFLNTDGGEAETVENLVRIIRFHYSKVYFVVPDYAMSAGTIFCMSGNEIYMDYSSSLGPIDPQVFNGKDWVPALGYLDQVQVMNDKSDAGIPLTEAEMTLLQSSVDLAELNAYQQARDLTIKLLKKWLVDYKFSDWTVHQTNPTKKDQTVTQSEKEARAEEIAKHLSDNKVWHSHGRKIDINTLRKPPLSLKIQDYSQNSDLKEMIRGYNDLLVEHIKREDYPFFLHSKMRSSL